jgi:hypothetical protein
MKTTRLLSNPILALAALAVVAPSASAAGLLGQRSLSALYGTTIYESAAYRRSDAFAVSFRQPLSDKLDLNLDYRSNDRKSDRLGLEDGSRETFLLSGCFLGQSEEGIPFLRAGLGWCRDDYGYRKADGLVYSIGAGAQVLAYGNIAVTPYVEWTDSFQNRDADGVLSYGIDVAVDVSSSVALLARLEGDDHFNATGALGLAVRF